MGFLLAEAATIDLTFLRKLTEIRIRLRTPDLTSMLLKNMQRPEEVTGSLEVGAGLNKHLPDMRAGIQTQVLVTEQKALLITEPSRQSKMLFRHRTTIIGYFKL